MVCRLESDGPWVVLQLWRVAVETLEYLQLAQLRDQTPQVVMKSNFALLNQLHQASDRHKLGHGRDPRAALRQERRCVSSETHPAGRPRIQEP